MSKDRSEKDGSRGIRSVEIGYRVLLAIQRGPAPVQLAEVARRVGLSSGAAHNYVASLIRTGLVEQEGRGLYRLGPSAFALSLSTFDLLAGYDVLRSTAEELQHATGHNVAVAVWSQGGPVSVFIRRTAEAGGVEFRSGLIAMTGSAAGRLCAAYLPEALTAEVIASELAGDEHAAADMIEAARQEVLPRGLARLDHSDPHHSALAAPVWTADDRLAFILSIVTTGDCSDAALTSLSAAVLSAAAHATARVSRSNATGPVSSRRHG